jgi:hypothetical protein
MTESMPASAPRHPAGDFAPEAAPGPAAPAGEEPPARAGGEPPAPAAKPDLDEVKRKFREALDAKHQARSERNAAGGRDAGRVHGTQGPAGGKRSFRRKSG